MDKNNIGRRERGRDLNGNECQMNVSSNLIEFKRKLREFGERQILGVYEKARGGKDGEKKGEAIEIIENIVNY